MLVQFPRYLHENIMFARLQGNKKERMCYKLLMLFYKFNKELIQRYYATKCTTSNSICFVAVFNITQFLTEVTMTSTTCNNFVPSTFQLHLRWNLQLECCQWRIFISFLEYVDYICLKFCGFIIINTWTSHYYFFSYLCFIAIIILFVKYY